MRKVIVAIIVALLLGISTNNVNAASDCVQKSGRVCPAGKGIGCYVNDSQYCCSSQSQCTQFENDSGQPGGTYGGNNISTITCTPKDGKPDSGINTAIGCVPALSDTSSLMNFILTWAIGVGGGIAFLLILYAGFQIMTSQGDPQRLKGGQELLTAAISGIIMLIFSVFILRVIGVNILGI